MDCEICYRCGSRIKNFHISCRFNKKRWESVRCFDDKGKKYNAPLIIGADGAISTVAQKSGLRSKWSQSQVTLTVQYDFQAPSEKISDIMGDETLAVWWGSTFPASYQVFFNDGFHQGFGNWMTWWEKIHCII